MATLFVDKLDPQSGTALEIGTSGDTVTIPAGATLNVAGTVGTGFTPGITMAYQWRLTADFTGSADPIASNWEQADTHSPGQIGSVMSQSSGIFTFPSTGVYLITFIHETQNGSTSEYITNDIQITTNDSSYTSATTSYGNAYASSTYQTSISQFMFDVTSTSTHKCRFYTFPQGGSNITTKGDTGRNRTCVTFIRLGDT